MDKKKKQFTQSKIRMIKEDVCQGCFQDRYNHKGLCERPGIDSVVTSENCWHLEQGTILYDRYWKRYYCRCGDSERNRESQSSNENKCKMRMNHNRLFEKVMKSRPHR